MLLFAEDVKKKSLEINALLAKLMKQNYGQNHTR